MPRANIAVIVCLVVATAFAGCIGTTIVTPDAPRSGGTSIVRGQVDPRGASFEFISETAGDPNDPIEGPFVLRGTNLLYDATSGEISVDLSVVNLGSASLPEPVSVTFVGLQPAGVSVVNPDNDEHGPGAMIEFDFANDDGVWTLEEESLARSTRFAVNQASSVGFSARIDVGVPVSGGSIGGVVWDDRDRDGVLDIDERGIGGVRLELSVDQAPGTATVHEAYTNPDGTYRFDGLEPGFYRVVKSTTTGYEPTTDTVVHVLLIEGEAGVHDFLMANFGCVASNEPPAVDISVGDYVEVKGEFLADPPRIVAAQVEVEHCPAGKSASSRNADDDCKDYGELRGPVTDVDAEQRALQINGTWLRFPVGYEGNPLQKATAAARGAGLSDDDDDDDDLRPEDVQVGQRVRARSRDELGELLGFRLRRWNDSGERIRGLVEEVQRDEAGHMTGLRILRTEVVIPPETRIE